MAYAIFWNEELFRIAEDDTQKNNLNLSFDIYNCQTITSEQFQKLKKERATASYINNNVVITDKNVQEQFNRVIVENLHILKIERLEQFLKNNTSSHPMYSACQNYKQVLESFDYSTVEDNENKTWGEYCDENSIIYLNLKQIP
jgi:hypothetical protein